MAKKKAVAKKEASAERNPDYYLMRCDGGTNVIGRANYDSDGSIELKLNRGIVISAGDPLILVPDEEDK